MRKLLALTLTAVVGLAGFPVAALATTMAFAAPSALPSMVSLPLLLDSSALPLSDDLSDEFEQDATGIRNARRLGGRTAFQRPPLTDIQSLHRMMTRAGVPADIRKVMELGGLSAESGPRGAVTDTVVGAMTSWPAASAPFGSCDSVRPAEGIIAECDFQPGSMMRWMSLRPQAPKSRAAGIVENVRWAGAKPFRAFIFTVSAANRAYTFVVPKDCGNLALLDVRDVAPAPTPTPTAPPAATVPPPAAPVPTAPPAQPQAQQPQQQQPQSQQQSLECIARDGMQKPLPGSSVRARNAQGQIVATATTDERGQCIFGILPPGTYVVEMVGPNGLVVATSAPVTVTVGSVATAVVTTSAVSAIAVASGAAGIAGFISTTAGVVTGIVAAAAGTAAAIQTRADASPSR